MANENIFTFDTNPFLKGLDQVSKGMIGLTKNAGNMAKNVSKGIINAVAKLGLLKLAFTGVSKVINEMPEIGKTFGIAKDIIMKNFLFPIRKAIFPLLQKFLDWVRDNRAMFVRWGQTLANIFGTVVDAVQEIIKFGGKLAGAFRDFINKTFGLQIKTFQDMINVLTFKIAVLVEFLKALAEPALEIFNKIVDVVSVSLAGAFETASGFVDGFLKGITGIDKPLASILTSIEEMVVNLTTANANGHSLKTVFEGIGELLGKAVNFVTEMIDGFLTGLKPATEDIMTPINEIVTAFNSIFDDIFGSEDSLKTWKEIFTFLGGVVGDTLVGAFDQIAGFVGTIADGIKFVKDVIETLDKFMKGELSFEDLGDMIIDGVGDAIEGVGNDIGNAFDNFTGNMGEGFDNLTKGDLGGAFNNLLGAFGQGKNKGKFDDVIITKRGDIVEVSPDDNILAAKNFGAFQQQSTQGSSVNVRVDFTGMNINIQNATEEEAQSFGSNIVEIIRNQLNSELVRTGG